MYIAVAHVVQNLLQCLKFCSFIAPKLSQLATDN